MIDFPVAIASVTKGLELLKALKDVDKNFDSATYKGQIADLTVALADAKRDLVDARDELAERDKEIDRLKTTFHQRLENTVVVHGQRFERDSNGGPMGMPYCDRCETVDGRLIRLAGTRAKDGYKAICPQCKSDFGMEHGYTYPEQRIHSESPSST